MRHWLLTLHGPQDGISQFETGESQFVLGTESAADVLTVAGAGVMPRHAWIWISEAGVQVEDLAGGTLVNGHAISEKVEAEYPASIQVGEMTLLIEVKADDAPAATHGDPLAITIPQRAPTRGGAGKTPNQRTGSPKGANPDAPLTGGYTLVREIARGGMGQIYFSEDPQLDRQVAVKVSSISESGEDPRFSKEARVLAKLAHPNIVPIYNIGVDAQRRPFYSMKMIKGRTLQAVLNLVRDGDADAVKDYPRTTLLTIFRKVCDAMMFAHSKGILHRDLKPENIMVGEYGEVLVMDWGLAKVLGEPEVSGSSAARAVDTGDYGMTMEGEVMGTPQYMSPEQASGMVAELDARSDIYSLGGILYAILTLRPPINGKTLDEVLTKVKNGAISSMATSRGGEEGVKVHAPSMIGAEVPNALQAVTLKAMATDRNKRYSTVEAFAADIERYQNGFATNAEDAGALKRVTLWIGRNKVLAGSAAILLGSALVFTVRLAASERIARANEQKALVEKETARRAAASAQIALAEVADSASDAPALARILAEIPEDLRSTDWHYLQGRVDTSDFTISAPDGGVWRALEDWPSDPDSMVALTNRGEVMSVNATTGVLQLLWTFRPSNGQLVSETRMGISDDGKLVAISYAMPAKGGIGGVCVDICKLEDGSLVSRLQSSMDSVVRVLVSGESCAVESQASKIEVWHHPSGRLLWEAEGKHPDFSPDQKFLFMANSQGATEKRDAQTGQIRASGVPDAARIHMNFRNSAAASQDWSNFLSPLGGRDKIRAVNPWTGATAFELTPQYGNYATSIIPPGKLFATLGRVSDEGSVLEIRTTANGLLEKSIAVPVRIGSITVGTVLIRAKSMALAVQFKSVLKIWRIKTPKFTPIFSVGNRSTRLGNSQRLVSTVKNGANLAVRLSDGFEMQPQKAQIQEIPLQAIRDFAEYSSSPDGKRLICERQGLLGAFRHEDSGLVPLWGPQKVRRGDLVAALHPTDDLIWTGDSVLEFSSGRELMKIKREGLRMASWAAWIGSNRVIEIAKKADEEEKKSQDLSDSVIQLVVWDTSLGKAAITTSAPKATCICVSPDNLHLAEGGLDKRVRIRNSRTLEVEQEFRVHEDRLSGIAWHPTKPLLVTAAGPSIRIWDLRDIRKVEELTTIPGADTRVEITSDGLEITEYLNSAAHRIHKPNSFQQ